jgi:hypothetical protein
MSNRVVHRWERFNFDCSEVDECRKLFFVSALGQVDMTNFHILHHGVDTVRQLYTGVLRGDVLSEVMRVYEDGFGECLEFGGHVWLVGSGGKSGYKYRLQNSDLGLILFLKSNHATVDKSASHMKIECSPHWLLARTFQEIGKELDSLADLFLIGKLPCGCAIHLCCDVQGWSPDADSPFLGRLVTRARRIMSHESQKLVYLDTGEMCHVRGGSDTYLLGSASSVQFCVYRKDVEAERRDKLHFWRERWGRVVDEDLKPVYDSAAPVWRLEVRFHHSVVSDFGRGALQATSNDSSYYFSGLCGNWEHVTGLESSLTSLWRYGLDNFRLEVTAPGEGRYLDPAWQILMDDVIMYGGGDLLRLRRVKKKAGEGGVKNLMLAVGNLLSCYARHRFETDYAVQCLKSSGIYDDLWGYFFSRSGVSGRFVDDLIWQFVRKGLQVRILQGRAA